MTDVTNLATAFLQGGINPSYSPLTVMMAYSTVPQQLPTWVNADIGSTQQVASLLGGSVIMAAPPGNYQYAAGSQIPQVPWVTVADGAFVIGDVFPPGVVLSFGSLCAAANEIAAAIPGGTVGNSCVGSGVTTPAYVYQAQAPTVNATNTTNVVPPSESAQSGNPVPSTTAVASTNQQTNTTNTTSGQNNGSVPIEIISGVPDWLLVVGVGLVVLMMIKH